MRLRLVPDDPELGWTPYAWLVYLIFPFTFLLFAPFPSSAWLATAGAAAAFLPIYFWGFWLHGKKLLAPAVMIAGIGLLLAPVNPGASTFVIYAAGFLGRVTPPRWAIRTLLALVGLVALASWMLDLRP